MKGSGVRIPASALLTEAISPARLQVLLPLALIFGATLLARIRDTSAAVLDPGWIPSTTSNAVTAPKAFLFEPARIATLLRDLPCLRNALGDPTREGAPSLAFPGARKSDRQIYRLLRTSTIHTSPRWFARWISASSEASPSRRSCAHELAMPCCRRFRSCTPPSMCCSAAVR
jgi:hypothetical protein